MQLLDQLFVLGQTWTGSTATLLLIILTLLLRQVLPFMQRSRATTPLLFLSLALVLGLSATVALKLGAYTVWSLLSLLDLLSLIIGVTSFVSLAAFDLVLRRTQILVPALIRNLIHVSVILLIVLTILYQRGLDPLSLLTTSAVLTAVIGLALQNTIANLFAGLALQIDRTLGIGHWIRIGEKVGRISEIKWRSTLLWTEDGDLLIVPNHQLLDADVLNLSRPDTVQREEITVGFHYRHPPNEVKQILLNAVRNAPGVLSEPKPDCLLLDFADSALTYKLRYWINDYTHHSTIASEVRTRVWYAAQRAGLEIPFPIRTLVMEPPKAMADAAIDRRAALEQSGLFSVLSEDDRARLVTPMKTVRFAAGEDIIQEGDTGNVLYIICNGEVAVSISTNGARRTVATLKLGDFFGESPLMAGESHAASYTAVMDTVCIRIDHAALASVLKTHPQVAEQLYAVSAAREVTRTDGRQELSNEAQARRSVETRQRFLARMQRDKALFAP
ncbi:MAG TPA: mechanosensitive ion channel family protein [Methylomirabilota bacterium]|nr:mechanosensitive ion channel family protein [Methylomirabilota bacterium]